MTVATILTRFRDVSDITTLQYSNQNITDQVYLVALSRYNHIMDTSVTITTNTSSDELIDEIIANLCASYCWRKLYKKSIVGNKPRHEIFDQDAYSYMKEIDPSKIGQNEQTLAYFPLFTKRGKADDTIQVGQST